MLLKIFAVLSLPLSLLIVLGLDTALWLLPLIYILPNLVSDHTTGVYMAEPVADIIAVTFTAVLFTFQFRKAMKKIENQK